MSVSTENVLESIAGELQEFERRLHDAAVGDLGPMADPMQHIVRAGGKRLRPALVILSAQLGDADEEHMFNLAVGIEFIHTATLVHDDLIDRAPTRRGITTIHEAVGPNPAIIIGGYYFAKGAHLLASIRDPAIDSMISNTVMTICLGELLQMTSRCDYDQSVEDYYLKIERKTATLLSACCHCGSVVAGLDETGRETLKRYGFQLGMAFQIADDVLDYTATAAEVGKPVGADLRQGTVTLPLMYALADPVNGPRLRRVLDSGGDDDGHYAEVVALVRASTGVERAERDAHRFARLAREEITAFPASAPRDTLERICDYVVERRA
ncbi:MAG: polyprenyl synthetase family protein [Candidatus Dormibacteria bacterium]